jgi:two-component system, chemotaxis family, response regulator Rcp1
VPVLVYPSYPGRGHVTAEHEEPIRREFQGRPAQILLVEDSPSDTAMIRALLEEWRFVNEVHALSDGDTALGFVRREGKFASAPRPDLILLDLNLPGRDGRDLLKEIKEDRDLRTIPVIVLTSSSAESDILGAYVEHANAYITKPVELEAFLRVIKGIEEFWMAIVRLPPQQS